MQIRDRPILLFCIAPTQCSTPFTTLNCNSELCNAEKARTPYAAVIMHVPVPGWLAVGVSLSAEMRKLHDHTVDVAVDATHSIRHLSSDPLQLRHTEPRLLLSTLVLAEDKLVAHSHMFLSTLSLLVVPFGITLRHTITLRIW